MISDFVFTSESVTEGHPDKLCDQISDAIVDRFLSEDPFAQVRAEAAVAGAILFIASRFSSTATVDFAHVARKMIRKIGYDEPGFNARTCSILTAPMALAPNPRWRIEESSLSEDQIEQIHAQNQVTVFGFACDHTTQFMPLPIYLAHRLCRRISQVRRDKLLPYLLPDGRAQVGVAFRNRRPYRIHGVTLMVHLSMNPGNHLSGLFGNIRETVILPVFETEDIRPDRHTRIIVNPEGPYLGGPVHHSGLTGRKLATDTYGEYARHSGKALSGKDPVRIDRVGAYAARHAAKNLVAAGLAGECEVMISYAIGETRPVSIQVQSFGTGKYPDDKLERLVKDNFDFRPGGLLKRFGLRHRPAAQSGSFFQNLAAYGHFGRSDLCLPWENTDIAAALVEQARGDEK